MSNKTMSCVDTLLKFKCVKQVLQNIEPFKGNENLMGFSEELITSSRERLIAICLRKKSLEVQISQINCNQVVKEIDNFFPLEICDVF